MVGSGGLLPPAVRTAVLTAGRPHREHTAAPRGNATTHAQQQRKPGDVTEITPVLSPPTMRSIGSKSVDAVMVAGGTHDSAPHLC